MPYLSVGPVIPYVGMGSPVCEGPCLASANLRHSAPGHPVPRLPFSHWRFKSQLCTLSHPLLINCAGLGPTVPSV